MTAEGVDTGERLRFLRVSGRDQMQGCSVSRPLPEDEVLQLLRDSAACGAEKA